MDLGLHGRTALVCASTSGLGEAVARALGAEGAAVAVSGRRGSRAEAIAAELPRGVGIEADLLAEGGPERLAGEATRALGAIDILVLNGPGPRPAPAVDITADDAANAVETLVRPHLALLSLLLPGMRERGWGRVLAVGSSGVAAPLPNLDLSNLGRSALAAHLKTLATEVAADGVTVNMLLPGRIATDRTGQLDSAAAQRTGRTVEEVEAESRSAIPAKRYGRPEEFGTVAAFLCGAPASYVTGTALRCDGGLVRSL
jgi:3-oxoacyl-[acyl-carrier protein] reductase